MKNIFMGFRLSLMERRNTVFSESWCVLILLWSLISFNVVIVL